MEYHYECAALSLASGGRRSPAWVSAEGPFSRRYRGFCRHERKVRSAGAGVFSVLADPSRFAEVFVDCGVVTWPGEIDLAPDAMHRAIRETGQWVLS